MPKIKLNDILLCVLISIAFTAISFFVLNYGFMYNANTLMLSLVLLVGIAVGICVLYYRGMKTTFKQRIHNKDIVSH